jgi:hypothetical protein
MEATMKRVLVLLSVVFLATAAVAAETQYERLILPIAPSYSLCGYHSRYETRLHAFNEADSVMKPVCFGHDCSEVAPHTAATMTGPLTNNPLPVYMYVPKEIADDVHFTLMTESRNVEQEGRAYTELPVLRERDFKNKIQLLGVRVEPGFRVTSRVLGLDTPEGMLTLMRVLDMETGDLVYEKVYALQTYPIANEAGLPSGPAFAMECDLSDLNPWYWGRPLRIEVLAAKPGAKIYAFLSVTDNESQRFTTITPK